jgi:hypothetical protein
MPSPFPKHVRLAFTLALVALPLAAAPAAVRQAARSRPRPQPRAIGARPQPEEGKSLRPQPYEGTVEFTDAEGRKLDGQATFEVRGDNTFVLTGTGFNGYQGSLFTGLTGGEGTGKIRFPNDREISIKWTQCRSDPERMKIVSANKECPSFRFCSRKVNGDECRGVLRQPC